MRKSTGLFLATLANLGLFALMLVHAAFGQDAHRPALLEKRELVRRLELTDLCLFTEARYTRHLSQADLNTPFQDYPMSLEHFPSGSFVMPPEGLRRMYETVD